MLEINIYHLCIVTTFLLTIASLWIWFDISPIGESEIVFLWDASNAAAYAIRSVTFPQVFSKIQKMIQKYMPKELVTIFPLIAYSRYVRKTKVVARTILENKVFTLKYSMYCVVQYILCRYIFMNYEYDDIWSYSVCVHITTRTYCTYSIVHHPMYSDTMSDKPHIKFIEPLTWISIIPNYIIHPLCLLSPARSSREGATFSKEPQTTSGWCTKPWPLGRVLPFDC